LEKPFDPEAILNLTTSVGPSGLIVASPQKFPARIDVGLFINATLRDNGLKCRHVTRPDDLQVQIKQDEILVLDMPTPLIEGMELYKHAQDFGHRAQTVLVPHSRTPMIESDAPLSDVTFTGILNKPFDPMELINKLPRLAA
jgi:DNA-binding response OmpR family regulator